MENWDADWSDAAWSADRGMAVVDGLMSFASATRGNPTNEQRSLYVASVAFSYAVWENYVEDLAVELAGMLSAQVGPDSVPDSTRRSIEQHSAWELAVHPGWRGLWADRVRTLAKGDSAAGKWGMNTASFGKVVELFEVVGVELPPRRLTAPQPRGAQRRVPARVAIDNNGELDVKNALAQLIEVRGEAVHTARTTDPLYKDEVLWWSDFVRALYHVTDESALAQCRALVGMP